nr:hypothetical protein [Vibrio aphrogenes]
MKNNTLALFTALILMPGIALMPAITAQAAAVEAPVANSSSSAPSTQERIQQLAYTAQDIKVPLQERAQALRQLARYPNQNSLIAVARALKDSHAEIREAALIGAEPYKIEHRWTMVSPLLSDKVLNVRIVAAENLLRDYNHFDNAQQQALEPAIQELISTLQPKNDPVSQLRLADAYRWHHQWKQADTIYRNLLSQDVTEPQLWLNLADNENRQQHNQKALDILNEALVKLPNNADIHYSKAMTLVRLKQKSQAAQAMQTAATLAKSNSHYWYLNGVIQEEFNVDESTKSFEQAYLISGAPEQLYAVCGVYARHNNPKTGLCISELAKYAPPQVIEQLKQLANKQ